LGEGQRFAELSWRKYAPPSPGWDHQPSRFVAIMWHIDSEKPEGRSHA
jgi:hypothetical protein